jgi:signal transduction histidine kinase/Na+/proline symporter
LSLSLPQIFSISLTYLFILFGSAYATERGWIPRRFTHNRFIRVISLGVYAGAFSFFGTLGFAQDYGASFMLYYFGASAVFILAPLLLYPVARISLAHKLGSLADLFAFRYPRSWVGGIVALFMLTGAIPLIALQIQAVAESIHLINQEVSSDTLAAVFCMTMAVFAILFGARHVSTRNKHEGLVVALALESTLKLIAYVAIAAYALFVVFGSTENLNQWLLANYSLQAQVELELSEGSSRLMLLTFFAGAITMPHMFHILLTENDDAGVIRTSRWAFPLYMLILGMCVAPIFWAATFLVVDTPAEFFALGLGLNQGNNIMVLLAFIGGFAACSGVLIVLTLALASMSVNHLVLPVYQVSEERDFFAFLLTTRRTLIMAIITLAYLLYHFLGSQQDLMTLGFVSFIGTLQFLPGLIGAFYWRNANSYGLLAGLLTGFMFWAVILLFPLLINIVSAAMAETQNRFTLSPDMWFMGSIVPLLANIGAFILFSKLTPLSPAEITAAEECMSDSPIKPYQGELGVTAVAEIEQQLSLAIGESAAAAQIKLGLEDLGLNSNEQKPFALLQLRNQIESNLTSIVGQTVAHRLFAQYLPFRTSKPGIKTKESMQSLESRFELNRSALTGVAAELDILRRHHRQLLEDLPAAVCTLDYTGRVLTWNKAMIDLTGIGADGVLDYPYQMLPTAWAQLFSQFIGAETNDLTKVELPANRRNLTLNLHKQATDTGDILIVIEDVTEEQTLEEQLMHNQRLAAIGQLAAGVAHEVGNPVTGIACLAQDISIETEDPELQKIAREILQQTERITAILNSLVNFAHRGSDLSQTNYTSVKLKQCIDEAIYLLSLSKDVTAVKFDNQVASELVVPGDEQRLLQVFVNLLSNARDASPEASEIQICAEIEDQQTAIHVIDHGIGIKEEERREIFEPFYTTKDPGKGTGLGLAIVSTIVQEHQGSIVAEPVEPSGTEITIRLPNFITQQAVDSGPIS